METLLQRYDTILERLVREVRDLYGARLVAVAVYGSVGRGTMREDSDVDLLIVARRLSGRRERRREFDPIEDRMTPLLDPRRELPAQVPGAAQGPRAPAGLRPGSQGRPPGNPR